MEKDARMIAGCLREEERRSKELSAEELIREHHIVRAQLGRAPQLQAEAEVVKGLPVNPNREAQKRALREEKRRQKDDGNLDLTLILRKDAHTIVNRITAAKTHNQVIRQDPMAQKQLQQKHLQNKQSTSREGGDNHVTQKSHRAAAGQGLQGGHQDWEPTGWQSKPASRETVHRQPGGGGKLGKLLDAEEAERIGTVPLDLAKRIQQARTARGMKQGELAALINERVNIVNDYENGRAVPDHVLLNKLDRALGVKLRSKHPLNSSAAANIPLPRPKAKN